MPVPVILGIRIRAERAQPPRDRDQTVARAGTSRCRQVWHTYSSGSHCWRPPGLRRQLRMARNMAINRGGVAENQGRLSVADAIAGMKREQSLGAAGRAAGRAANEFVDRGVERQRARLDLLAQRIPRREAVLARDHGLRVVQRQRRPSGSPDAARECRQRRERSSAARSRGLRGAKQRLGLLLQLVEIRPVAVIVGASYDLHARACGSQSGSTAVYGRRWNGGDSGLGPSREPAGAF